MEVSDPFGTGATRRYPVTLNWAASRTYSGSLSRTILEYTGPSGQLGPAKWDIYVEKAADLTLTFDCDVSYIPYTN